MQDNLNLLLTEEEMYSLMETFKQCKIIPGEPGNQSKIVFNCGRCQWVSTTLKTLEAKRKSIYTDVNVKRSVSDHC